MTDVRTAVAAAEPDEPNQGVARVQQIMSATAATATGQGTTAIVGILNPVGDPEDMERIDFADLVPPYPPEIAATEAALSAQLPPGLERKLNRDPLREADLPTLYGHPLTIVVDREAADRVRALLADLGAALDKIFGPAEGRPAQ